MKINKFYVILTVILVSLLGMMAHAADQLGDPTVGKCYTILASPRVGTEIVKIADLEYCREAMGGSFDVFMSSLSARAPGSNVTFTDGRPFYTYYGGIVTQASGDAESGYRVILMAATAPVNGLKLQNCGDPLPEFAFQTVTVYPNCEYK